MRFTARHDEILRRYRDRLAGIGSPVVRSTPAWAQCRNRAVDALLSCSRTLGGGTPVSSEADFGTDRGLLGIQVCHWVKASVLLFEATVPVLIEEVNSEPGGLPQLGPALDSLLREVYGEVRGQLARALRDEVGSGLILAMRQLELLEVGSEHGVEECSFRVTSAKAALVDSLGRMRRVFDQSMPSLA